MPLQGQALKTVARPPFRLLWTARGARDQNEIFTMLASGNFKTPLALGVGAALAYRLRCSTSNARSKPPVAKKKPHHVPFGTVEGEDRGAEAMPYQLSMADDYFWMRDDSRKDPEVIGHLRAENEYAAGQMAHLAGLRTAVYDEMLSHVQETDDALPYQSGAFFYYSKTVKGLSYRIYCRKSELGDGAAEQVMLDMNQVSEGKAHCDLGCLRPSPDHATLCYTIDETGYETYKTYFLDLATGAVAEEDMPPNTGSVQWGADSRVVFYAVQDEAHRPYQLWKHVMGTPAADDELLFTEPDGLFWLGFGKSRSGRFLTLGLGSSETSEEHVLDLEAWTDPATPALPHLACLQPREFGVQYDSDHCGGHFYIVTNADGCKNRKLVRAPVGAPGRDGWEDVMPYDPAVYITDVDCFAGHVVVSGREGGFTGIWVLDVPAGGAGGGGGGGAALRKHKVSFEEEIYTAEVGVNRVFDTATLRFQYSSLTTPGSTFDYDMTQSTERALMKRTPVPNYDASLYACERTVATAADGTEVPMSLVWRKDKREAGKPMPTLLYGYGSYGICIDPEFSPTRVALLDRGMCYCIAHIRGGGEMGRTWYEDEGKYLTKKNTFSDFVACAEHLLATGVTTAQTLGMTGRSAGGLLMGGVLNLAPQHFKCAIAGVPFVDLMNTMSDPSIPLTTGEWEEWGNPNAAKYFQYMLEYSPYDNVKAQDYPAILITAGLHDPRVAYWEPAKWVAKLRDTKTDSNVLLIKTDLESGHFSASDRYKWYRETSFDWAFLLDQLGLNK